MLRERGITGRDAAFATELTYGTCRARGLLDAVIAQRGGPARRPDRPGAAGPAAARRLPTAAHPGRAARRGGHHRGAGRHRIRYGASGFRQRRAAHHRQARRSSPGSRSWRRRPTPTRSGTSRSCTPTRDGSPRRSPTRSARTPGSWTRCWPATTSGPSVHLAARPGVLTADELAGQVDGTVGRYSPYAVYLPGGDPGRLDAGPRRAALVQDEGSQLVARALTLADRRRPRRGPVAGPVRRARAARPRCWPRSVPRRVRRVTAVEPTPHARRARRAEHPRPAGRGAAGRRPRVRACDRGVRPGARRRAVHRAGRAAAQARGPLAPSARRRAALAKLQRELLASAIAADPSRRGGAVRDVFAASGRDGRRRRRRAAPPPGDAPWTPGRCSIPVDEPR